MYWWLFLAVPTYGVASYIIGLWMGHISSQQADTDGKEAE